jgi:hypothetical protein
MFSHFSSNSDSIVPKRFVILFALLLFSTWALSAVSELPDIKPSNSPKAVQKQHSANKPQSLTVSPKKADSQNRKPGSKSPPSTRSTSKNVGTIAEKSCGADYQCAGGSICFQGSCRPRLSRGEKCGTDYQCAGGNICFQGSCRPRLSHGERCGADYQCAGGGICFQGSCRPRLSHGEKCGADYQCAGGNICFQGSCRPRLSNGEKCGADYQCAGGNTCYQGSCQSRR